jgi:hypothetical protein
VAQSDPARRGGWQPSVLLPSLLLVLESVPRCSS